MNKEPARRFYSNMHKIRRFEQEVSEFYKTRQMAGLIHLCIGEEAAAADVYATVEARDYIASTHHGHGHLVVRGGDMGRMMTEILGKEMDYSRGKGGSIYIVAMDLDILGANGIMGGGIPMATGAGYSAKHRGTDQVTLCFFGDGAANKSIFHESINMAVTWGLPVVYVTENNLYSTMTDGHRVTKEHDLAKRAIGYGIPGYTIDGSDIETAYKTMQKAVEHVREGKGPSVAECKIYHYHGHNGSDLGIRRPPEKVEVWKVRDPLILFRDRGYLTERGHKEIEDKVEQGV